ncbi:MAG: helix-turn-helix transcriptional regulator [Oligoflexia bacterium]|nr:helix-turn-helix transcriptional regulator [Oligoflexia bacterium]
MIKIELNGLISWLEEESGTRLTIGEIADGAGVHRNILSRILNKPDANTSTEHIDKIAQFFFYEFQNRVPQMFDGGELADEMIMEQILNHLVQVFPEKKHHAEFLEANPRLKKAMDVGALWEVYTNFQKSNVPMFASKQDGKKKS